MVVVWEIWAIVILGFSQVLANSQNLTCNSSDLRALRGFMDGLESPIDGWWPTNSSSLSSSFDCCNWVGIKCNSNSGRIVGLELPKKRLTGSLSDLISNLDHLKTLNLSNNFLTGPLPISLFHLTHLEVLDLSRNGFNGVFPVSIRLPALEELDFSDNFFSGSIPGICVNSTGIRVLKFAVNSLTGIIPPELRNCSFLNHLCIASNSLSGAIPEFLFQLPRLGVLDLQDNMFTAISEIGNSSGGLISLDVSCNRLSGNLPDFFRKFPNLSRFSARSNGFSGGIPASLLNSPAISFLNLRNNSLDGSIEFNWSMMTNLTSLDLGSNNFSGFIPDDLSSCRKLKAINLARNKFSGQIPESFKNFRSLSYLSLSNCSFSNLSTTLKILQHCPNLTVLVLTMNFHSEKLPDDSFQFNALKALVIANCGLVGSIPPWLKGLTQLQLLDLSWNQLDGSIPPYLGDFRSLFYLDLSNNSLSGEIPKNLTQLQSLSLWDISLEEGSPDFPFFRRPNMSNRGSALQYNQIMSFPPLLDLSNNFLNGSIWPEFGNLKRLHVLDLKHNDLSGEIPSSLSGMASIETLDLSYNNLTGMIPPSLVNLSFLSKFSVAYNNLSGLIPNRGQFATFANLSFEGNELLCGSGRGSACGNRVFPQLPTRESKKSKGKIAGMAVGIGFGTLFLLALMFLIIIRATGRQEVDPENEDGDDGKKEELETRLIVFFRTKGNGNDEKEFSLDDLLKSTNSFDQANIIGCGGFGLVFKATLPDGRKVAIKRLSGDTGQADREFQAEVETLSRAQHPNLVLLQGYCQHNNDRLLIYSFMENGSLDYWLHEKPDGPTKLNWSTRLNIAKGAINGLAYLHQSCDPHILHRDIKSSNILLDENFEAHLADFGLARLILPYDTHKEKREIEVFDPIVFDKENGKQMLWVLEVACVCLNESPKLRPSTRELLSWLHHGGLNA
ncbi:Concanavalin A-like lectin/glucanase, subgroup [Cynara cardunculus var. scolymus]|uniref:Concanavalin A-like lectin/glucanase, subgroup n=1 Tax=Cynara cardunculus var. scolymus TaxID=59895 RepID=A0A124SDN8_CYNCS|nr:Concanavalin A-like lectin/glucanase, subgroup [Cynara cardunculus var. scolymus]